jgi:hypothetical protein
MSLTRAQLLMGNTSQGTVLSNQVQGVKQGAGVLISADGTISFDSSTVSGVVRLNNAAAYNNYVWPGSSGTSGQVLQGDGLGNLSWVSVSASAGLGLTVDGTNLKVSIPTASTPPVIGGGVAQAVVGSLYWDDILNQLFIYYTNGGTPVWVQAAPAATGSSSGGAAIILPSNPAGQTPVNTFSPTSTPLANTSNTFTYTWNGTAWTSASTGGGGGSGTVTSVGIIGTSGVGVVSGSPVTSAGSITLVIDIATLPVLP